MLSLDYSLASGWDTGDVSWAEAEEWQLRYDFLLGDVEFVVFEQDLSARWGWVPVLDFALSLDSIVDGLAAAPVAPSVLEFTESDATITFTRCGDSVEIEASYVPGAARVGYPELRGAAKAFLGRVLGDAVEAHPTLASNPFVLDRFGSLPTPE